MVVGTVLAQRGSEMLPLESQSVKIEGVQSAFIVSFTIKQAFKNNLGKPVEVRYVFPTDARICVYDTSFTIDGKEIKMDLKEKAAAEATYNEAVSKGQTAVISRSLPNGLDEFVIGNLDTDGVCEVTLHCSLTSASSSDSSSFFKFPLDRVLPDGSSESLCRSISGQFEFGVSISQPAGIASVTSNCGGEWTANTEMDGTFKISSKPNQNAIIVTTNLKSPMKSFASVNGKYITATLYPNLPADSVSNSDFIFVVDCSGSMMGGRIQMAAECLKFFLRSLPSGCGFDIVRFGSNFVSLFDKIEPYNDASLARGLDLANQLPNQDLGGTEILEPLMSIFKRPAIPNRVCQIFVISDGEVSNTDSVISHVAVNRGSYRVFTVGVGTGADAGLINGLAEVSMGQSIFVNDGDDMTSVVMNQLEAALSPAVTDLQFHIEGCDNFEITPFPLPPVFNSTSQTFIIKKDQPSQGAVMCSGSVDKNSVDIGLESVASTQERGCEALFAFRLISDLMRKIKINTESGTDIKDLRSKVVELSLRGGVLSEYTAFVGISEHQIPGYSAEKECDMRCDTFSITSQSCQSAINPMFANVDLECDACPPQRMAAPSFGIGNFFRNLFSRSKKSDISPPPDSEPTMSECMKSCDKILPSNKCEGKEDVGNDQLFDNDLETKNKSSEETAKPQGQSILQSQTSGGYWEMASVSSHLKGGFDLPSNVDTSALSGETLERVKATVAAIALLRRDSMGNHNTWKLMERKALQFLKSVLSSADWDQIINSIISSL